MTYVQCVLCLGLGISVIKNEDQNIDIWNSIESSLLIYPPVYTIAFFALHSYQHSLRKTAKMLGLTTKETARRLAIIKRKVRKDLKQKGIDLNLISNIIEEDLVFEITENDEEINDN